MINMLKADFYRLIRSKGFYVAIVILLMLIGIDIYTGEPGGVNMKIVHTDTGVDDELNDMSHGEIQAVEMSGYRETMLNTAGYALDRDVLAKNINLYYIFIFVAAIVIAVEFSGSTIKNALSSAISRNRYFLSKVVFVNLCCLGLFFLNTYIMYFANILFNNRNLASDLGVITRITLLQLPPILALISILTGLAFVLKKTAAFNTITILLVAVCQFLLSFAVLFLNFKEKWLNYELQQMLAKLADDPSDNFILHSYLVCAVIIIVFYLLGYLSFKKAEIK